MTLSTEAIAGAMQAHVLSQEITARNLANVNTPGFKRNIAVIEASAAQDGNPAVTSAGLDLSEGAVHATAGELDLAVHGEGFFAISTESGLHYTRNGTFRLNENRMLVTQQGNPVMGEGGEIQIPEGQGPIVVGRSGEISAGDQVIGRLSIVAFDRPQMLRQTGGCEFADEGAEPRAAQTFSVRQGYIEDSNVNPISELVRMTATYRNYESCARSLRSIEDAAAKLYTWARS